MFEEQSQVFSTKNLDLSRVEPCQTRQGEPNLLIKDYSSPQPLHAAYSAAKETDRWVQSLEIDDCKVLYVYGIGLGYSFEALKSWLAEDPERYLIYLEDDRRILHYFMKSERMKDVEEHPQVMVMYVGEDEQPGLAELVCQDLAYYFVRLPFKIAVLPFYDRLRRPEALALQTKLMHASAYVTFVSIESMDYGAPFFQNFYSNILSLPDTTGWRHFPGAFKGVPAIICGAGPSLNKNFDLLKTLRQKALIMAGGSAVNALTCRGLMPHLGGSVDPNRTQLERMSGHPGFELPIFYKGRAYHGVLHTMQGPMIYLPGNTAYPITDWLERELGVDEPEVTEGHNVLHLLIDLARRMGCNPIIFVGMDLAYTGLQQYADAVVEGNEVTEEEITKGSNLNDNAFPRKDIHGNTIYTLWKWVAESNYSSSYAKEHPDVSFINATEGGLGFEGIENLSLQEVADRYLKQEYDLDARVHALIQRGQFEGLSREAVIDKLLEIYRSLHDSLALCEQLVSKLNDFEVALRKGRKKQIAQAGEEVDRVQGELSQELAVKWILEPVNHMRSVLFERQFDQASYEDRKMSDLERMLERCQSNKDEVEALKDCAQMNLRLLRACVNSKNLRGFDMSRFLEGCREFEGEEAVL